MKFTRKQAARERAAADAFDAVLDYGGDGSPAAAIAAALRPRVPLNESRRALALEGALAAFEAACLAENRPLARLDAPDVATAEVLTEHGRVLMADVETIDEQRAQEAAEAALRHVETIKGEARSHGADWNI